MQTRATELLRSSAARRDCRVKGLGFRVKGLRALNPPTSLSADAAAAAAGVEDSAPLPGAGRVGSCQELRFRV